MPCLTAYYSSGEAIVCATLFCFYFELYGRDREVVVLPEDREFSNSVTDLIWPGAWYIYSAAGRLSDKTAWDAIKMLLPGTRLTTVPTERPETDDEVEGRIISLAKFVEADPANIGVLSTGERIAMALLFGKLEWLPEGYTHPLDAINRLGERWLSAVRTVYETGWE